MTPLRLIEEARDALGLGSGTGWRHRDAIRERLDSLLSAMKAEGWPEEPPLIRVMRGNIPNGHLSNKDCHEVTDYIDRLAAVALRLRSENDALRGIAAKGA